MLGIDGGCWDGKPFGDADIMGSLGSEFEPVEGVVNGV